jgi:hypothetical protein
METVGRTQGMRVAKYKSKLFQTQHALLLLFKGIKAAAPKMVPFHQNRV